MYYPHPSGGCGGPPYSHTLPSSWWPSQSIYSYCRNYIDVTYSVYIDDSDSAVSTVTVSSNMTVKVYLMMKVTVSQIMPVTEFTIMPVTVYTVTVTVSTVTLSILK